MTKLFFENNRINTMKPLDELKKRTTELTNLNNILALLQWDQEVMMPSGAASERASQFAVLSGIIHQKISDPGLGDLIEHAKEKTDNLSIEDQALIRIIKREYEKNIKLPEKFVVDFARLTSEALPVWVSARQQSDFKIFQQTLEKIIVMCRQQADYLGYTDHPYDALLDIYEEGLTTEEVTTVFASLKHELVGLVKSLGEENGAKSELLANLVPMTQQDQVLFSEKLLGAIGYDFDRGRQDISAHPFTTSLGHNDRRVTNRFRPDSLEFIFSALHEGGHALYEQGIAEKHATSPLDEGVSLGIHESQSRLWENIIGRSQLFWQHYYPVLQSAMPQQFKDIPLPDFMRHINKVQPGFIRVEADEVSYNLHVLIRFELEKKLLEGSLAIDDLPALWNEKYARYLGVDVDSDANGVLQDIHWAHGSFGYFPTYTIGNLAAAQIWRVYCRFDPDYQQTLQLGKLDKIRQWLADNIYCHGAVFKPTVLMERVCGEKINSRYFIDYLKNKEEFKL
jgi:carboxypeptidase Taq